MDDGNRLRRRAGNERATRWEQGAQDMKGSLIFEDGTAFEAEAFGSHGDRAGVAVAFAGGAGFQEAATTPSYLGRILVFERPTVGACGADEAWNESDRVCAEGLVCRELSKSVSDGGGPMSFGRFCESRQLLGLEGAPTREIAAHIRSRGEQWALLTTEESSLKSHLARLALLKTQTSANPDKYRVSGEALLASWRPAGGGATAVVLDIGAGASFYRLLKRHNIFWRAFGPRMSAEEILSIRPDAALVSNGAYPADSLPGTVATIKSLLGRVPVAGIGLGAALVASALGVPLSGMKSGHHGVNIPVANAATGALRITEQNHSVALRAEDLRRRGGETLYVNTIDGSVEGFVHSRKMAAGAFFEPDGLETLQELTGGLPL